MLLCVISPSLLISPATIAPACRQAGQPITPPVTLVLRRPVESQIRPVSSYPSGILDKGAQYYCTCIVSSNFFMTQCLISERRYLVSRKQDIMSFWCFSPGIVFDLLYQKPEQEQVSAQMLWIMDHFHYASPVVAE